jgi:hypothetical protein
VIRALKRQLARPVFHRSSKEQPASARRLDKIGACHSV